VLTVLNANGYTGPTIVGGGTLGRFQSGHWRSQQPIGASTAASSNLVFYGANASALMEPHSSSDRGATLNGSGLVIEVTTERRT